DQHVPAAAKVVRDARDPAAERALGDVLREAREEQAPEDGDVEHALVVRDDDVAAAGLEAGGALDGEPHPAEVEGPDERDLQRPGDVLLWALAEETRAALGHVEDEQDQGEDRQEDDRPRPGADPIHGGVALPHGTHAFNRVSRLSRGRSSTPAPAGARMPP